MGKRKMSFEEMVALRNENHEEFIKNVFENYPNNVFFDGELPLRSYSKIEKDGKEITIATDKWLMFTKEEKEALINLAKEKWEKEKAEIIKECEERYERTKNHPQKSIYIDGEFTASIICASLENGQEIPNWLFIKACRLFDKHRGNEDFLWKSYQFKGFVRWSQVEKAMKFNEHSNSKAKNE